MIRKRTLLNLTIVVESAANNMTYRAADAACTENAKSVAKYDESRAKFTEALEALREAIRGLDIP